MLIKRETLDAIVAGTVTLAFRRWKRPTVRAKGRLRTVVGELAVGAVDIVEEGDISSRDARQAGFRTRQALVDELAKRGSGSIYRVKLSLAGPDPRTALRGKSNRTITEKALTMFCIRGLLARGTASSPNSFCTRLLRTVPHDENRAGGTANHALGRGTEDCVRDEPVSMRRHHD